MRAPEHVVNVAVDLESLPSGWRWATVQEVGAKREQSVLTGPFGTSMGRGDFIRDGVPVITISCLTDEGIRTEKAFFVSAAKAEELSRYRLKAGDLLFSRMASVGRAGIVGANLEGALFNYHLMRLRLDEAKLLPKFFTNYVRGSRQVRDYLLTVNHGATRDGINTTQLLSLPVLLPPLDEQRLIVAAIEKQFTRLDAGMTALRRVQANLKRYRAAVLKAACEGRLVPTEAELARREGRSYETGAELVERLLSERQVGWSGRGKYTKPIEPPISSLAALPDGWTWGTVDQTLRAELCNGVSVKGSDNPPGVRALRLSAMSNSGFDYDDVRYLPLENSDVEDLFIVAGDFFVSRGNGSLHLVGRGTSSQLAPEPTIFPDTMIRLRFVSTAQQTRWLPTIWASPILRRQIEDKVKTTAGIYKISQPQLASIVIPLPPLDEQIRIIAEVERRVSVLQELETALSLNLQRATRLRQSVLQRAFSGALVSQGRDLSCQEDVIRRPGAEGLR